LGEEWTGEEPHTEFFQTIKILIDERAVNNAIARHLPHFGRKEYHGSMAPPPIGYADRRPTFDIPDEQMKALGLLMQQHNEGVVPKARERFTKVQNAIADYAIAGKLRTSFRAGVGGGFNPIPADWWNTERLERRFAFCSINPSDPFSGGGKAWIFVARADLEAVIKLAAPRVVQTMTQGNKCQQWLEQQFAEGVQETKKKFFELAKEQYRVSWKHFLGIWYDATKNYPDRRGAGRKAQKNRHPKSTPPIDTPK
jgi:hypothetical protein